MDHLLDSLTAELRCTIRDLRRGGGMMGPSIYDTAQVARLAPPPEGARPALTWLVAQQQPDGGWGDPLHGHARDVPTLAALLALGTSPEAEHRAALRHGVAFLHAHARLWEGPQPEDMPTGVELLVPCLLDEARRMGIEVPHTSYATLIAMGRRRHAAIVARPLRAGTPICASWEALGLPPTTAVLDATGGVGHSPAATAAWLHATEGRDDLAAERANARGFLEQASASTGTGVPGVYPNNWPIDRFEQAFGLYALLLADLLRAAPLADVVSAQLSDLRGALGPSGLGFSDVFAPDGDDTACALALLHAGGLAADASVLSRFASGDHYCAWPGELQSAVSVTAHAAHALALLGTPDARAEAHVAAEQHPDGRWTGDKWNGSWLYTTAQALVALPGPAHARVRSKAVSLFLSEQRRDGGWGTYASSAEETAYGVLALRTLPPEEQGAEAVQRALAGAQRFLLDDYRPFTPSTQRIWLAKELYRPLRIARLFELAATYPAATVVQRAEPRRVGMLGAPVPAA
ncbi:hypothetical protein [Chondromyces apiculatus]|uniref:Squalene cyclase C-terminal domain-containing protein n=1 Tax=Chondromyces apiculatus DSM 436 TaxID=1192034 RepID=A0A017TJA0_9BACT|nr:hypothetical protein [Chondromyces apiculatus]EYF08696.1 Hypothetical protein CAP_2557 [Chondromyces apiculatus DSM 436]